MTMRSRDEKSMTSRVYWLPSSVARTMLSAALLLMCYAPCMAETQTDLLTTGAELQKLAAVADPGYRRLLAEAPATAGAEGAARIREARLAFAQAMSDAGGNWQTAQRMLLDIAKDDAAPDSIRTRAIDAFARRADGSSVTELCYLILPYNGAVSSRVLAVLSEMKGRDITRELGLFCAGSLDAQTTTIVRALGKRRDPLVLPALVHIARAGSAAAPQEATLAIKDLDVGGASAQLVAAGKLDEAVELVGAVRGLHGGTAEQAKTGSQAQTLGFIMKWRVLGPVPSSDLGKGWDQSLLGEPGPLRAPDTREGFKTETVSAAAKTGEVDLLKALGKVQKAFGFAEATVRVEKDTKAVMRLGSDDGVAVWVNGEKVHENRATRGMKADSDTAALALKAGSNRILLKISQNSQGWGFCARLTDADGMPLEFEEE
jgi:hypothetical protein